MAYALLILQGHIMSRLSHSFCFPRLWTQHQEVMPKSCLSRAFCFPRLWTQHQEVMPKSLLLLSPLVNATSRSHGKVMPKSCLLLSPLVNATSRSLPQTCLLLSPLVNATSRSHASVMPFAFPACERNIKKSCLSHVFCFPRLWTQHQEVMPQSLLLLSPLVNATSRSHA